MIVLGIETSCDETAASVVRDGREVLSSVVYSQIAKHERWGGVIPEIASRLHLEFINRTINEALQQAAEHETSLNSGVQAVDAIAVSNKPGLLGSLLVGVNAAKTLAWLYKKPLIPVNHLLGHICANYIDSKLEPPFICLLASGGHTQIIRVDSYSQIEILGETIDDAAGEAFDKVARLLNLPYPGGPHLDKLAQEADDPTKYSFTVSKVGGFDFSFSGLKTAVLRLKEKISEEEWNSNRANIAKAFQNCVAETFYRKINKVLEETNIQDIVLAGGVAANSGIRGLFREKFPEEKLCFPSLKYCTDNAAMIASAGYFIAEESSETWDDMAFEVYSRC